jgi:hypothetical protein
MATEDRTPPADGFYWFRGETGTAEVVQVADGLMMFTGTDQHRRLASWPARSGEWPDAIEGRILGHVPLPDTLDRLTAHCAELEAWKNRGEAIFTGPGVGVGFKLGEWWADRPWRQREEATR